MENNKRLRQLIEKSTFDNSWKEDFQLQLENEELDDFNFELSLRIIERLEELGWKKSKLAQELGVSKQYVSKILKTKQTPNIPTVFKIQKLLGIKLIGIPGQNPKTQHKTQITIKFQDQAQTLIKNSTSNLNKIIYPNQKQLNSKWLEERKSKSPFHC